MANDDDMLLSEESLISLEGELDKLPIPEQIVERMMNDIDRTIALADKKVEAALEIKNLKYEGSVYSLENLNLEIDENKIFGVDGTYYIASSVLFDIIFIGAIGISYDKILFDFVKIVTPPSSLSGRVAQGIMASLETKVINHILTNNNPELIMYDGSFISLLTRLNSFYAAYSQYDKDIIWAEPFVRESNIAGLKEGKVEELFSSSDDLYKPLFSTILESDKIAAIPKKMTSSIILRRRASQLIKYYSDGVFFSIFLKENTLVYELVKMTDPEIDHPTNYARQHTYRPPDADLVEKFFDNNGFYIIYYKPYSWSHALKIEIPANKKVNQSLKSSESSALVRTLLSVRKQIISPEIREPLIKFLAHLYCKQLIHAAKAYKDALFNKISRKWLGKVPNIPYYASGYRTNI